MKGHIEFIHTQNFSHPNLPENENDSQEINQNYLLKSSQVYLPVINVCQFSASLDIIYVCYHFVLGLPQHNQFIIPHHPFCYGLHNLQTHYAFKCKTQSRMKLIRIYIHTFTFFPFSQHVIRSIFECRIALALDSSCSQIIPDINSYLC